MDRQPDKLFREKLRGFQKPVPQGAWKRISENLHPEERRYPWIRMAAAAAVLLILVAALLLFLPGQEDSRNSLANRSAAPKMQPEPSRIKDPGNPQEAQQTVRGDATASAALEPKATPPAAHENSDERRNAGARAHRPDVQKEERNPASDPEPLPDSNFFAQTETASDSNRLETTDTTDEGTAVLARKQSLQRVKIVFSAEEVDEKYLNKKELAEATREDKNSSSIRKLLDKAYDLKFNQDPMGQLRQKKNEILALNFRNEKVHHD